MSHYDALQGKDYPDFLSLLGWFTVLAASYIALVVFALYFAQMLQIRWRRWLTDQYIRDWPAGRAYYLLQLASSRAENPEQRIQDDINGRGDPGHARHGLRPGRGRPPVALARRAAPA
jgi:vitamin B12/bleomycin/antimicrobial peptide transport system ATP-binding/permease protein